MSDLACDFFNNFSWSNYWIFLYSSSKPKGAGDIIYEGVYRMFFVPSLGCELDLKSMED